MAATGLRKLNTVNVVELYFAVVASAKAIPAIAMAIEGAAFGPTE